MAALRLPDWRGGHSRLDEGWHDFSLSEWPSPHARDRAFQALSLYVYPLPPDLTTGVWRSAAERMLPAAARNRQGSCLLRYCDVGWGGAAHAREFTSMAVPQR